uniref:Putative vacuolar protein sorting-associated protein 13A n=1 Tax=Anthurium amnicola TaxID=1678845 RepID=A0A1D1Z4D3_9ARAE
MFEGFVSQVLAGYLGRYVKGIQKDQLKIGIWNEEVLLDNVQLSLEAFDYLQLPFALKQGKIGKLSIKIPWKKLGWDPIVIVLEDIFLCACSRDNHEWGLESMEKRELAGKMAKLNAAELAKFSKRVYGNQVGQSFVAKILDNIQISMKNVHVMYIDTHADLENFIFGLRFSSLTIMTEKQNSRGSCGKLKGGLVKKILKISTFGIYCNLLKENTNMDDAHIFTSCCDSKLGPKRYDYLINPFDLTVSLLVNKSRMLDATPQYSVLAELTSVVVLLNEIQLQQILSLWDHFSICSLRQRYGRYRPDFNSLLRKIDGWQMLWWHYAQQSILADVRKRLRKTSWSSLGRRISYRRKYVNLYRRKLELIQQDQHVSNDILEELEQMDKECELDEILNYRSIAENQIQEFLLQKKAPSTAMTDIHFTQEKGQNDERSFNRLRGWLNWLSLGMLGAGGTANSSSFAGLVSDEIIKDIYEVTESQPLLTSIREGSTRNKILSSLIKFDIDHFTMTISSKRHAKEIALVYFDGVGIECKLWEDFASITLLMKSVKIINPCNDTILLTTEKITNENVVPIDTPCLRVQINAPPREQAVDLSIEAVLHCIEVNYDADFFGDLLECQHALATIQFQNGRVVSSLNGFEESNARLLSKAEYVFLNRKRVIWDVSVHGINIYLSQHYEDSEPHIVVLKVGTLRCILRPRMKSDPPMLDIRDYFGDSLMKFLPTYNLPSSFELEDLYDHFEIGLIGFQGNILAPNSPHLLQVFERFDASVIFRFCVFFDEPMLKQTEVHCSVSSLAVHISPLIYDALAKLNSPLLKKNPEEVMERDDDLLTPLVVQSSALNLSWFSACVLLDHFSFFIDLEDDSGKSLLISISLGNTDIRYAFREFVDFCFLVKMLKVSADVLNGEPCSHVLCSSRSSTTEVHTEEVTSKSDTACGEQSFRAHECFLFHYQVHRDGFVMFHKYNIFLNDVDFHIHPRILGMLQDSYYRIFGHRKYSQDISSTYSVQDAPKSAKIKEKWLAFDSENQDYCLHKFCDTVSNASTDIPFNHFPFPNTSCVGFPHNTVSSFIPSDPVWSSGYVINKGSPSIQKAVIIRKSMIEPGKSSSEDTISLRLRDVNMYIAEFHLKEIRVHFHDFSCILATIYLPFCASSSCFQGTDSWDILCYIDGLKLSSPWSTSSWSSPNISEFLWGPALPNISPVFNIHVKKGKSETEFPIIEISIMVQYVSCILPSEFLAMVIGYFCLPDWTLQRKEVNVTEVDEFADVCHLKYEFEILDSTLIIPLENCKDYCLQLGLPKLRCSFIPKIHSADALRGIPDGCVIPNITFTGMLHLVNVFGRGTSLSVLLLKDGKVPLTSDEYSCVRNVTLISKLDADLWIRIPYGIDHQDEQYVPTYIMLKADTCDMIIEDEYFFRGLEAAGIAIDLFSTVGNESRNFKSDVLQFIQLKRQLREANAVTELSTEVLIHIRICANALSLKLTKPFASSEFIAVLNIKAIFSAVLRNEMVHMFDADIIYVVLHSLLNSVVLLSFISEDSSSSVIRIHFSKADYGEDELNIRIPSLDIWFHLSDWNKIIDLVGTCRRLSSSTSWPFPNGAPSEPESKNVPEASISLTSYAYKNVIQEAAYLIVKSEKIVLSLHLPVRHKEGPSSNSGVNESHNFSYHMLGENMPFSQGLYLEYLTCTLQSRDTKLTVSNRDMVFKCSTGRMETVFEIIENNNVQSMPFIQLSLVKVAAEIRGKPQKIGLTISDVQVETLDLCLLEPIFKFWDNNQFAASGTSNYEIVLHSITFQVHLTKCSLLLSDRRWRCNGYIFDITVKNVLIEGQGFTKLSVESELSVNYNNIQKVMWEPFVEPWRFRLDLIRYEDKSFLSKSGTRDIHLDSQQVLNLNITESVIEDIFMLNHLINCSLDESYKQHGSLGLAGFKNIDNMGTRKHAPYIICNDTSLPLLFSVSYGPANAESTDVFSMKQGNTVQPGFSVPIYVEEPPEPHLHNKAAYSSERLMERKMSCVAHHLISVQLDGTSNPSKPMSMDLVGISYFEVDFSKSRALETVELVKDEAASDHSRDSEELSTHSSSGLVVPVVFDVSMHCYSKMIRLYSTVIFLNATSKSLELRFDIPFGVSPKILGPIHPGQEFPLPVHLAEAVGMRWRPVDLNYFWSEAHSLSKILSHENRLGFMRSFVCYPSCHKSDPFRCCISIRDCSVLNPYGSKGGSSLHIKDTSNEVKISGQKIPNQGKSKKRFIRQVRLTTPLLVKNGLPTALSLTIDSGGFITSICLSEVDTASIFQIDSTHDLEIKFYLQGYNPAAAKFPRAETFTSMAKFHETKFSLSEQLTFHPVGNNGPICLRVEKSMDAFCGAREIYISVPFFLYNCTGLPLTIVDDNLQHLGHACLIQSNYSLIEDEHLFSGKCGISVLSSDIERFSAPLTTDTPSSYPPSHYAMPMGKISKPYCRMHLDKNIMVADSSEVACGHFDGICLERMESHANLNSSESGSNQLNLPVNIKETENDRKVKAFMYAPPSHLSETDLVVRLRKYSPQHETKNNWDDTWSSSFPLVPASGSTNVIIPRPNTTGAFLVSVTSNKVSGDISGRTRAIFFQPRYVICNACRKDIYYKQRGTSDFHNFRLGMGQHSHLHWSDRTRDLLVSIRFDERGGQWSGSFLPDCLGDAQVKVRNYASGALDMVRVEIQNAGLSVNEEKVIGASNGTCGTYLILLSDDDSGFMPYRIDNFSMESLRIYQHKCETAETIVHSYTSCQYAWDEPCYPHRLFVEVPGEHILGSYTLDDVKEYTPVYLPPSSEKPERRFFIAIHAEGATKVLSIIDSRYHSLSDVKEIGFLGFKEEKKISQQKERNSDFNDRIMLHFTFIGISLINSSPQELIYAYAKETKVIIMQSSDKQKISLQIHSLQIDNQLPNAPYPILLSFDHVRQGPQGSSPNLRNQDNVLGTQKEDATPADCDCIFESNIYFAACKWRKRESSFVSYEYINLRVAPLRIELEEQVLHQFLDFLRAANSRLQNNILQNRQSKIYSLENGRGCTDYPRNDNEVMCERCRTSCYFHPFKEIRSLRSYTSPLPSVIPIGAPWQHIYRLARRQEKIYIEAFELAPIILTVSFSSNPWLTRKEDLSESESFFHVSGIVFQRGLMALVDVEGVPFHLRELTITHLMASRESIQEIVTKHYTKQFLHEIYKEILWVLRGMLGLASRIFFQFLQKALCRALLDL